MNRIEALKAARDGLDVQEDLIRFAREGWRTIADDDKERLIQFFPRGERKEETT